MADRMVAMYSKEQEQEMIHDLRRYIASDGGFGAIPLWYSQLSASQLLHCPPWELDEAFDNTNQCDQLMWIQRAGIKHEAERQAADVLNRRMQRGSR